MEGVGRHPGREVLIFKIAGQRYGLLASEVRELVRAVAIVPVPGSPRGIEGAIDVRGVVVPVLDLRSWLGLPGKPVEPSDHLILVTGERSRRTLALHVDQTVELLTVDRAAIEPVVGQVDDTGMMLHELVRLADGLVPLLNLRPFKAVAESASISSRDHPDRESLSS